MKKGNATLIGAFVVVGIALVLAGIILAGGGKLFARKEHVVMYFTGSIYGLQVGAPVVFRGVRLGSVTSIGLVYDQPHGDFLIPVKADLEPEAIRGLGDQKDDDKRPQPVLPGLITRGLTAQLSMQSLLTGQLYVDLDLRPGKPANRRDNNDGLEIPTNVTTIQNLKNQLDGMDFRRLVDDVSAIAASARGLVSGPQLKDALENITRMTEHLRKITEQVDGRIGPLADNANATLIAARQAAERVGPAAERISDSANRVGSAADRYKALVAPDSPLLQRIQGAADELSALSTSLRQQVGDEGGLVQNADQAIRDLSRAARAVRELADSLEQQPSSLLRGKSASPPPPPPSPSATEVRP
ncbi:MAG TPA: MlaD family protein [Ideonella sp.]|uniref:MlaD family protein n=1 Tax=Ideonella sp. TaxID=1929293 RepID=UPI002C893DF7|nr:MlaD family protein [Ideonella sp.]HSI49873.1 MlaD family protein [Ideonella sp.]